MKKLIVFALIFMGCAGGVDLTKTAGPPTAPPPPLGTAAELSAGTVTQARSWAPKTLADTFSGATVEVEDDAYGAGWNGDTTHAPSQNAAYDIISTLQAKPAEGAFVDGDKTKLDGIETAADVTDATNVAAAGALMTSSLAANVATFLGTPSLANLNAALTDAVLLDDGSIADSTAIGLNNGSTYTNFGVVGDDSLNELFAAIDTAIGGLAGGHDPVTLAAGTNGLSLSTQEITVQADLEAIADQSWSPTGTLDFSGATVTLPSDYTVAITADPIAYLLDSDSPGADKEAGRIYAEYIDGADGSENSTLSLAPMEAGTPTEYIQLDGKNVDIELTKPVVASSSIDAAGIITGLVNTSATPASLTNFKGSFTVSAAGSTSLTLPTAAAGYSVCIRQGQGRTDTLTVTPASGDYIVKDGVRGTIATAISSGGAATDKACFVAVDDTDWYMDYTGTWGE